MENFKEVLQKIGNLLLLLLGITFQILAITFKAIQKCMEWWKSMEKL